MAAPGAWAEGPRDLVASRAEPRAIAMPSRAMLPDGSLTGRPAHTYQLNGLLIESEHELATLTCASSRVSESTARLRVTLERDGSTGLWPGGPPLYTLPQDEDDERPFLSVWRLGRGALLRVHHEADFRVRPSGDELVCLPLDGCPLAAVEQLLVDRILPRVMHLRGEPCLHAAAIKLPDDAVVALVGPAGSGKSSTCAALCDRGAELVCDDRLRVAPCEGGVRVYPGYASLRLWPEAAEALLGSARDLPTTSPRTIKRRLARRLARGPLLLSRVLVLVPGRGQARIEPLEPGRALQTLAAGVLRLDPNDPKALRAEYDALTAIVSRVAVVRLRFEQDWRKLDELVELILGG